MAEGGLREAAYLEQHCNDLCIAFAPLIRNSGKQSSLSVLDNSHCVGGLLLTEWQAAQIYFLQPSWLVRSFKRKINQLLQFLAVLFHIILMAKILIRFQRFYRALYIKAMFRACKFFPISYFLPWLPSFTLTNFPARGKVLLCWSWDRKYKCFPKNYDGEVAANSHNSVKRKISVVSLREELLFRPTYSLLYSVAFYYCTLLCISDACLMPFVGVVMLLRFEIKCFVVCFISILKLEANFHNSIWNVWDAQKQLGDTVKDGLCQENEK